MTQIVPVAWYSLANYERIRQIMDDKINFPITFEEWEQLANDQLATVLKQGIIVQKVMLDPHEFLAYVRKAKIKANAQARVRFVAMKLAHEKSGQA